VLRRKIHPDELAFKPSQRRKEGGRGKNPIARENACTRRPSLSTIILLGGVLGDLPGKKGGGEGGLGLEPARVAALPLPQRGRRAAHSVETGAHLHHFVCSDEAAYPSREKKGSTLRGKTPAHLFFYHPQSPRRRSRACQSKRREKRNRPAKAAPRCSLISPSPAIPSPLKRREALAMSISGAGLLSSLPLAGSERNACREKKTSASNGPLLFCR